MKIYKLRNKLQKRFSSLGKSKPERGFSLIEVLIGMFLVTVAIVGLIQLFLLAILSNARADRISNGLFLAQQKIEYLRNLTIDELNNAAFVYPDEQINTNGDAIVDYRRLTQVQSTGISFNVRVLVFPGQFAATSSSSLLANPTNYKVLADISTMIAR